MDRPDDSMPLLHLNTDHHLTLKQDFDAQLEQIIEPSPCDMSNIAVEDIKATQEPVRPSPRKAADLTPQVQPWRVIFQISSPDPRVVGVDVHDLTVIGRSDPTDSGNPDLDLAAHGALNMGVSRRHAILLPGDDGLCLMDLDSTNGTWLNGVYLQPGQKYRLRAGDRVEFGRLRLTVRVVGAGFEGTSTDSEITGVTRPTPRRK